MVTGIEQERVAAAIRSAEAATAAEIVCVVMGTTSAYEFFPLVWAAMAALAAPAVLLPLTAWSAEGIYLAQALVFVLALPVLAWTPLRMRLVPRALQRRRAHRAAAEQFLLRGLARKRNRAGVLVFVAEAERYARIIADEAVHAKIGPAAWQHAIAALVSEARQGRTTDGLCAAVTRCGELLAAALPPDEAPRDELPDRVFIL